MRVEWNTLGKTVTTGVLMLLAVAMPGAPRLATPTVRTFNSRSSALGPSTSIPWAGAGGAATPHAATGGPDPIVRGAK